MRTNANRIHKHMRLNRATNADAPRERFAHTFEPPTEAERIASKLLGDRPKANDPEHIRLAKARQRVSLRWFSFEAQGAHYYRNTQGRLI